MAEESRRRLAAILAADVAGYSRLVGADEEGTLAALRAHRAELIDDFIRSHGGRIANTAGDSMLLEFPSAADEEGTLAALRAHRAELIDDFIRSHGGVASPTPPATACCSNSRAPRMR